MIELNQIINADCMDIMKDIPDKYFELAIVDPPYGIGADKNAFKNSNRTGFINGFKNHKSKNWDSVIPDGNYFNELFRVSQNQIITGANYFTKYLPSSMAWVFWYKMQDNFSFSDGEFIFTSFQTKAKIFKYARGNESGFSPKGNTGSNIHPTQKPVALYKWLLKNYATEGDKILDTHSGSGTTAIACVDMGFEYLCIEKDKEYFEKSVERVNKELIKIKLF